MIQLDTAAYRRSVATVAFYIDGARLCTSKRASWILRNFLPILAIFLLPLAVFEELTHEDTLQLVWEGLKRILPQGHFLRTVSYPDLHPTLYHPHPSF